MQCVPGTGDMCVGDNTPSYERQESQERENPSKHLMKPRKDTKRPKGFREKGDMMTYDDFGSNVFVLEGQRQCLDLCSLLTVRVIL